jgi:hypothetical protein
LVVRNAYTVDMGDVVVAETAGNGFERLTTIDVPLIDVAGNRGVVVRVVDAGGTVVSARAATADELDHDHLTWISRPGPDGVGVIEVAAGDTAAELAIRWTGTSCDTTWRIKVTKTPEIYVSQGPRPQCDALGIGREVIVTLDRPVDPAGVQVSTGSEGG